MIFADDISITVYDSIKCIINLSHAGPGTFCCNSANTMPADALALGVPRSSAAMILSIKDGAVHVILNTLRPRQNGHHFTDDTSKCIFLNENVRISIDISLKFVPKGPINNIPALVQIMAWHQPSEKPLSEPVMVTLPTHICVTRPQ